MPLIYQSVDLHRTIVQYLPAFPKQEHEGSRTFQLGTGGPFRRATAAMTAQMSFHGIATFTIIRVRFNAVLDKGEQ